MDLAARRIGKVIKLTKENDATRAAYNDTAAKFTARIKDVEKVLNDRTIDNTMAGIFILNYDYFLYHRRKGSSGAVL